MIIKIKNKRAYPGPNIVSKDRYGAKALTTQVLGHINPSRKNKNIEYSPKTLGNLDPKLKDRKYQLVGLHKL